MADKPTHRVYTVEKRGEGKDDYWTELGAAFPHKDGKGYNLQLRALPPDGKLVMRTYEEKKKSD
jgi:hypothetical protein